MKNVVAMVLAGGEYRSLRVLCRKRAKAALPFGGSYRIIDFVLSNLCHSEIFKVGILTQHRPESLIDHIGLGEAWDLFGRERIVKILPPYIGRGEEGWYKGSADAIYQNLNFLDKWNPKYVLILAGDHIYKMNYRSLISFHRRKKAKLTIAVKKYSNIPPGRFGVVEFDNQKKIVRFEEKPLKIFSDYISLGIYCIDYEILKDILIKDARNRKSEHHIGKNIIPKILETYGGYAYIHRGYWSYLSDIFEYWQANQEILRTKSKINLKSWQVISNYKDRERIDRPPAFISDKAKIINSIVSEGCRIFGEVKNSVLSPGVVVEKGAVVEDSVIMHDCYIGKNSKLKKVILDKDVLIGEDVEIGFGNPEVPNIYYKQYDFKGVTTIGKKAVIESGSKIGCNCIIDTDYKCKEAMILKDGEILGLYEVQKV